MIGVLSSGVREPVSFEEDELTILLIFNEDHSVPETRKADPQPNRTTDSNVLCVSEAGMIAWKSGEPIQRG